MVGEVRAWAGLEIPAGWLECDGSRVSKGSYSRLYGAIGDQFGDPGEEDFALPDLRDRVPVGASPGDLGEDRPSQRSVGDSGGFEEVLLQGNQSGVPVHNHELRVDTGGSSSGGSVADSAVTGTEEGRGYGAVLDATGAQAESAHENQQPFLTVRWIICAA
jgi:microcystin-dependent protein